MLETNWAIHNARKTPAASGAQGESGSEGSEGSEASEGSGGDGATLMLIHACTGCGRKYPGEVECARRLQWAFERRNLWAEAIDRERIGRGPVAQ
jgi:hypothetical protein